MHRRKCSDSFLSELKAEVCFSYQNLSVVRRCSWRCRKLFTFLSSPEPLVNFNQTWHKASLVEVFSSLLI